MVLLFRRRRYVIKRVLQIYGLAAIVLGAISLYNILRLYSWRKDFVPEENIKYILFWTPLYDRGDYNFGFGREPFLKQGCPVNECYTTNGKYLMNLSNFHAFVYNSQTAVFSSSSDTPNIKYPHQKYVFLTMESVQYDYFDFTKFPDFFDITMTYRHDSDIALHYGHVFKRNYSLTNAEMPEREHKTKLCAWFASKCETKSKREEIVRELEKYIKVDIYGLCGRRTCPKWDGKICDEMLRNYKFCYLAFENSLCPDYVTEKFYRALRYDVIPVVYGGANYSKFAPPHSYIDVRNFTSVESLADYLTLLSTDDVKYYEYFDWKRDYYVDDYKNGTHPFCKLCELLHDTDKIKASTADVKHWWLEENKCENPSEVINKLV